MSGRCSAIVLSAGKGKRMGTDKPKQYLDLCGKPVLYYSLKAFQDSFIDEIVIVASKDDHSYIKEEIVDKYGITKAVKLVEGGAERYDSVLCGLKAAGSLDINRAGGSDYVFIHDGARPFIDDEILNRAYDTVIRYGTAIVAVPAKDTVKIVDDKGVTVDTPDRNHVWLMQTPQVFKYKEILEAYESMAEYKEAENPKDMPRITDDAMVMEHFGKLPVHIARGSYRNIKITTPEDMVIARAWISSY